MPLLAPRASVGVDLLSFLDPEDGCPLSGFLKAAEFYLGAHTE